MHLANPKLRGVSYDPVSKKWRGRLYCLGQHITLGRFSNALEAAQTHDRAAYYVHGASALTNFGAELARQDLARRPPSSSETTMGNLRRLREQLAMRTQRCVVSREVLHAQRKAAAAVAGLALYYDWPPPPGQTRRRIDWSVAFGAPNNNGGMGPTKQTTVIKTLVRIGVLAS